MSLGTPKGLTDTQKAARTTLSDAILAGLREVTETVTALEPDEVILGKNFVDDLDIDSLSMVEMVVVAEDKYGVEVPDKDIAGLRTVDDVLTYVLQMIDENPQAALAVAANAGLDDLLEPIRQFAAIG